MLQGYRPVSWPPRWAADLAGGDWSGLGAWDSPLASTRSLSQAWMRLLGQTRPGTIGWQICACKAICRRFFGSDPIGGPMSSFGRMASTQCAAVSAMRRNPQLGQSPRPLQLKGTHRSSPQLRQRSCTNPSAKIPQRR